jgi:DNA polymerase-3 subunit delta
VGARGAGKLSDLIYVFYGEDDFSSSEAIKPLLAAVGPEDMRDSNVSRIDAGQYSIERFGAAAMVVPFLADRRVVVVSGLLGTAETQRGGRRPAARRRGTKADEAGPGPALAKLLPTMPPSTDAVFVDAKLSAGNPILTAIKELGPELVKAKEFAGLKGTGLGNWVRERVAAKGAQIDQQALAELCEVVGPNLWAMDGELEKLAIYVGARAITLDDVKALVAGNREASVFELVDAIMAQRADKALEVTERLFNSGAAGPYLISMIARQARMVAIAQDLARRQAPQGEWASALGTSSDFVVRKSADQARRFSPEAVRSLYRLILEADMAMKTGETTDELAITELLAQAGALQTTQRGGRR